MFDFSKKIDFAILGSICLILITPYHSAAAIPIDRLILEVNKQSYTQRQVILYVTTRRLLQENPKASDLQINQKNWTTVLSQFSDEMIIEQEAQRLGSRQPNAEMVKTMKSKLLAQRRKWPIINKVYHRMAVTEQEMKKILASIIRVQSFLITRKKTPLKEDSPQNQTHAKNNWFDRLKQRTPSRYYEQARNYVPIEPNRAWTP